MSTIRVKGGRPLSGSVVIEGSKNAVLPILAATILGGSPSTIQNVPLLEDVRTKLMLLENLGVRVKWVDKGIVRVDPEGVSQCQAPHDLVRRMRASLLVLGPLLSRLGVASSYLPGGCAIGTRPIDLHLKGFQALGASVSIAGGALELRASRLKGNHIYLDFPSVTATENIMMAATLAPGVTLLENAAEEPEVSDLATFLNSMGARIYGAGTSNIRIVGVDGLSGAHHTVIPDRIEAGTYMIAGSIVGGDIQLEKVVPEHLKSVVSKIQETGASVTENGTTLRLRSYRRPRAIDLKTLPYPGFPTDMQAPFMALLSTAMGTSMVTETVFENRFLHVDELKRMGARIRIEGRAAVIDGVEKLSGAPVKATDLRAGAALVLAGIAAEGTTEVMHAAHIERGYVDLPGKMASLGAAIEVLP